MTRIKQTDVIIPAIKVQADMWHRDRGDGRVRVARAYHVEHNRDGSGAEGYLLTRYENRLHVAMSSLLRVEGEGFNVTFIEVCREARRNEGDMMAAWYDREGAVKDGLL